MSSSHKHAFRFTLGIVCCAIVSAASAEEWTDPPSGLSPSTEYAQDAAPPSAGKAISDREKLRTPDRRGIMPASSHAHAGAARDLAVTYLRRWSSENTVALASAPQFYSRTVSFHGRDRSLDSVLSEKRRFAERWPERIYRHRPETLQVACEDDTESCTVWSIFDFSASHPARSRTTRGIGEHEVVVSFAGPKPVIVSETSRVLFRGNVASR